MFEELGGLIKAIHSHIANHSKRWQARSRRTSRLLEHNMSWVFAVWAAAMFVITLFKVMVSPTPPSSLITLGELVLPYAAATLAPAAGFLLARASFPGGAATPQPRSRLARWGKWRTLTIGAAESDRAYGPSGLVTVILVGLLLNVVIRTAEFAVAVPAMNSTAPEWGRLIMFAMTADLVVLNFFYMACFVMAIRGVPLFPRMLVFTWLIDLQMQLAIANFVGSVAIPDNVASALIVLLDGNIQKVLISIVIWLPILILSRRINITYRLRERA